MKCQRCKTEEAVIHIQGIEEGREIHRDLCRSCAEREGIVVTNRSVEIHKVPGFDANGEPDTEKVCGVCGTTWSEVAEKHQIGCPDCVYAFRELLDEVLSQKRAIADHRGIVPRRLAPFKEAVCDRENLWRSMEEAAGKDDFERAVALRDRIRSLDQRFWGTKCQI